MLPLWRPTLLPVLVAATPPAFLYAGQAVLEGVMFRGQRSFSVAVRLPSGTIAGTSRPLPISLHRWRNLPLLRGVLLFMETVILGVWAIRLSERLLKGEAATKESPLLLGGRVAAGLALGAALFLLLPLLLVDLAASYLPGSLARGLVEGAVRLLVLLAYIVAIGWVPTIRRVFAYHGAEHKVGQAFAAQAPLQVEEARAFSRFHPWCGTTVLVIVLIVAAFAFPLLGQSSLAWGLAARFLFMPLIAAASLELILVGGSVGGGAVTRLLAYPGLWIQRLTTREPTDEQVQVAIHAFQMALREDEG